MSGRCFGCPGVPKNRRQQSWLVKRFEKMAVDDEEPLGSAERMKVRPRNFVQ